MYDIYMLMLILTTNYAINWHARLNSALDDLDFENMCKGLSIRGKGGLFHEHFTCFSWGGGRGGGGGVSVVGGCLFNKYHLVAFFKYPS